MSIGAGKGSLVVVSLLALLAGCQQAPPSGTAPVGSMTLQLKQEGDGLAARGEYAAAADKYQAALSQEPSDLSLRFALGTTLSYLGRREDTIEQFRFVVTRGRPDSTEVQTARGWLIAAGELAESVTFAAPPNPEPEVAPPPPASIATGRVKGRTVGRGTGEVNLALRGDDDRNREIAFPQSVKLGQPYEFAGIPPGNYRLKGEDAESGTVLWDQRVTVTAGKETVLDLTTSNSN